MSKPVDATESPPGSGRSVHQGRKELRQIGAGLLHKVVVGGLRSVYTAPSEEAALAALKAFERQWSEKYPAIAPLWKKDRERLAPFFDYAPAIRKVVYATNVIGLLNYSLCKIVKGRGAFPNDEAVHKLLYLIDCAKRRKNGSGPYETGRPHSTSSSYSLYGDRVPNLK